MMIAFLIFILSFLAVLLLAYGSIPVILQKYHSFFEKKTEQSSRQLEELYFEVRKKRLFIVIASTPFVVGFVVAVFFQSVIAGLIAAVFGFIIPSVLIRMLEKQRVEKLHSQLVDVMMILSSSLKAGLTLLQAIEMVVEEMPAPTNQEFGMVLKQIKMGMPFEEALERLNKRMVLEELKLICVAIVISRETGGNLVTIIENLVLTLREKKKVREQIKTLTLQGRWQGMIMSVLPLLFGVFTFKTNPHYLETMLSTDIGRGLLIYAGVSLTIGIVMIQRISKHEDS